jgi:hypothetical protein
MSQSDTTTTEKLNNVSTIPDAGDADAIELSTTVDVTGLPAPRKLFVKQMARRTEKRFILAFGGDTDDVNDVSDTREDPIPREIETVELHHVVDTSDRSREETYTIINAAQEREYQFRMEVRGFREKHAE